MDEAERCHDIAYIFNGRLIARGTSAALIRQSHLVTYRAEGEGAFHLAREVAARDGVVMAAPFGQALHVSGTDRAALEAALQPYRRPGVDWNEVSPTLEDVFILLMAESGKRAA
jgi:ABC-2 type transport system ATP-binding protein